MEATPSSAMLERGGRQLRWLLVAGAGGALLLAAFVPLSVIGKFHVCLFLKLTGYPCMFCGMTRAFLLMAHGDLAGAWHISPLGVPLFLLVVAALFWGVACLVTGKRLLVRLPWRWVCAGFVVLLLANWIYRLTAGLK
jgi:hypothetical protein